MRTEPIKFTATIDKVDINPYVKVPVQVLNQLFEQARQSKGKIPINVTIDGYSFKQTLVKFRGLWRLYINGNMRSRVSKDVGDTATFSIWFDEQERILNTPKPFSEALARSTEAQRAFNALNPSLQREIIKYLSFLKTESSLKRNVEKAIRFLEGKGSFIGRETLPISARK
jgi:hypothetical protein